MRCPFRGLAVAVAGFAVLSAAADPAVNGASARELLDRLQQTTAALPACHTTGVSVADMTVSGRRHTQATAFTLTLDRPARYRITWQTPRPGDVGPGAGGAVWSGDAGPHVYLESAGAYAPFASHELAFATATGVSGGTAIFVPSMFYRDMALTQGFSTAVLTEPERLPDDAVEGEPCRVVRGKLEGGPRLTFAIAIADGRLRRLTQTFGPDDAPDDAPDDRPEMTDEALNAALRELGRTPDPQSRAEIRAMLEQARTATAAVRGTITHTYRPEDPPDHPDAWFARPPVPAGTPRRETLFDNLFGAGASTGPAPPVEPVP